MFSPNFKCYERHCRRSYFSQTTNTTTPSGQSSTTCTSSLSLSLLVCTSPAVAGRWTSQTTRSTNKQLSTSKRTSLGPHLLGPLCALLFHPLVLVCVTLPPLSPACCSGKQAVQGHSRAPPMGLCCSLLRTPTCLWQCPIITPPSCGRSSPLPPGIPACWPPGVFPLPRHSADQISAAGHEAAGFLWHHYRPQLPLQRNGCMYMYLA